MFTMADWADPGTTVIKGVDVVAFYLGGWATHIWTAAQINEQTVALMLPIWVYNPSKTGGTNGTTDGNAAVSALKALSIPRGVRVGLDMETSVDLAYCTAFRNVIANNGYWTTIYGSASFLFGNWFTASGPGGGWWVADWTGTPHLYNHIGVWATQYSDSTTTIPWDRSSVSVLDHLWPHIPASFAFTADANGITKTASFTVVS